ncbi:MAG: SIS domain-containing protein, partial [Actinobacteria bacterium]|nr:SIS domain-containing protein [Actinomycetota bacterium]
MKKEEFHTFKEILKQPDSWQIIYSDITAVNDTSSSGKFRVFKNGDFDEIIFFGCGSSYNLSQSASFFARHLAKTSCSIAVPSSELLTNPDLYFRGDRKYLAVGFSRSGETSESVEVAKILRAKNNVTLFAFSCRQESSLCKLADACYACPDAVENSIVMTISFSSMLLAFCAIFAKSMGNPQILKDIENLIKYARENLLSVNSLAQDYVGKNNFSSFFAL